MRSRAACEVAITITVYTVYNPQFMYINITCICQGLKDIIVLHCSHAYSHKAH